MSRNAFIISIVLLLLCLWLYYISEGPHSKTLEPGTSEYKLYHGEFTDTLPGDSLK